MTNYTKTKIYKIESHLGDKIYIGSTAKEYLSQRFQQHKSSYKRWKNGLGSKITSYELFDLYGMENCSIVLIEACPCASSDEKRAKEGHYIKTMTCVNKNIAGRTRQEWYEANPEYSKEWRKANPEYSKEHSKAYREANIEHCKEYDKAYREANVEHIKEYDKAYRLRKKAEKLELRQEANDLTIEQEIETIINA